MYTYTFSCTSEMTGIHLTCDPHQQTELQEPYNANSFTL